LTRLASVLNESKNLRQVVMRYTPLGSLLTP